MHARFKETLRSPEKWKTNINKTKNFQKTEERYRNKLNKCFKTVIHKNNNRKKKNLKKAPTIILSRNCKVKMAKRDE